MKERKRKKNVLVDNRPSPSNPVSLFPFRVGLFPFRPPLRREVVPTASVGTNDGMTGTAGGARPPTECKRGGRLLPAAETRSSRCLLLESGTKEGTAAGTVGGPIDDDLLFLAAGDDMEDPRCSPPPPPPPPPSPPPPSPVLLICGPC